jgi:hypothetical protein
VLCLVAAISGCVSYTVKPVPIPRVDAMPNFGIEGPVALGIDPYFEIERQRAVFDEKLADERVLAARSTTCRGITQGGGLQLLNEFYQQVLKMDIVAWPIFPTKFLHSFRAASRSFRRPA